MDPVTREARQRASREKTSEGKGSSAPAPGKGLPRPEAPKATLRLAAIIESSEDAIVSKDLNGVVTTWNKSAERIFGYAPEEMIGRSITTIIPPELQSDEVEILRKIRAGERIEHFHTVRLRKDGDRIDVSLTISPIKDDDGKIIGASKIARDVTRQKIAEQALARLAAIVESSDDAIVSKDLNGVITSWNRGAERIFGYKAEEIIGRPITTIIPPELHSDEIMILGKMRAGERIDHFHTVRLHKNGDRLDVSLTVSPIRNENGTIIGAAKIARDITRQKKLEAALHMSERLASVGRLAATVAHEINNPLEAITNFIYLAKRHPGLPEKIRSYLEHADQELARVAHIAQQTLGFYRDSAQPGSVPIPQTIEDVLAVYERKVKYKSLSIERRIEAGLTLYTLQGELKQILSNLLSNAIDASREDGRIIIAARASRHFRSGVPGVRITIADNGMGMSARDKQKIFAPFFTTKKEVGTGLGLWITKDLLEKRGGQIRFRSSNSGRSGTVMSIYLPAGSPATPAELVA